MGQTIKHLNYFYKMGASNIDGNIKYPEVSRDSLTTSSQLPEQNFKLSHVLLYLYGARNKITQLSIPTHAQLQRHRLNLLKTI